SRRLMPRTAPADDGDVGQRLVTLAAIVAMAAITAAAAPGSAGRLPNWAAPQIATVVAHKLMGAKSPSKFRPNAALTRQTPAQILGFGQLENSWQIAQVQSLADSFTLPQLNDWQRRILAVAFSKIGMPYIWGGTNDNSEVDFGVSARGGYDCSGFVWRVYKLE